MTYWSWHVPKTFIFGSKITVNLNLASFISQIPSWQCRGWSPCIHAFPTVYLQSRVQIIGSWRGICFRCHRGHGKLRKGIQWLLGMRSLCANLQWLSFRLLKYILRKIVLSLNFRQEMAWKSPLVSCLVMSFTKAVCGAKPIDEVIAEKFMKRVHSCYFESVILATFRLPINLKKPYNTNGVVY